MHQSHCIHALLPTGRAFAHLRDDLYANDLIKSESIRTTVACQRGRMKAPPFEYIRAAQLQDAIAALAKHGQDAKAIAGGQSLVPMLAFRLTAPRYLVDIGRIPDLNHIIIDDNAIRLGALVRWCDI